jgi:hypothetical protein
MTFEIGRTIGDHQILGTLGEDCVELNKQSHE